METVPSPRHALLKTTAAALLITALIGFFYQTSLRRLQTQDSLQTIDRQLKRVERKMQFKAEKLRARATRLHEARLKNRLNERLNSREALIVEDYGVIFEYWGEVLLVDFPDLPLNHWSLAKKGQEVFFTLRLEEHLYYSSHFFTLENDALFNDLEKLPATLDWYFSSSPLERTAEPQLETSDNRVIYPHNFAAANHQLALTLAFDPQEFSAFVRFRSASVFAWLLALLAATALVPAARRFLQIPGQATVPAAVLLSIALLFLLQRTEGNLSLPGGLFPLNSTFALLAVLFPLLVVLTRFLRQEKPAKTWISLLSFNFLLIVALFFQQILLNNLLFASSTFTINPDYLSLVLLLLLLYYLPLRLTLPRLKPVKDWKTVIFFFSFQAIGALTCHFLVWGDPVAFMLISLLLLAGFFLKKKLGLILLLLGTLAFLLTWQLHLNAGRDRDSFISENLRRVILSQGHYAKLIAREILYEVNTRQGELHTLFVGDRQHSLTDIWKRSLAGRLGIPSGIFVLNPAGEVLSSFSNRIPYVAFEKRDLLPFWHIEEISADLYGREYTMAAASIDIFHQAVHLGRIMIQVPNSPEVYSGEEREYSIFSANPKAAAARIGYLKMDESGRIRENPFNLTIDSLDMTKLADGQWFRFQHLGSPLRGLFCRGSESILIIFHPLVNPFQLFSTFILLLLFISIPLLLDLGGLPVGVPWRLFYHSFSVKVFLILILISLLTASTFSLFTLNYNRLEQERRNTRISHERGMIARNIAGSIFAGGYEIRPEDLFFLSRILETDVHLYKNGILLFSSNPLTVESGRIPLYLHSDILRKLNRENREMEISTNGASLDLFFAVNGDLIFQLAGISENSERLPRLDLLGDFLISLFFLLGLVGTAAALFFRRKIIAPIDELNKSMLAAEKGVLEPLGHMPREVELQSLYQGFNAMISGIREQKRSTAEISRMKTLINLSSRVAHEIKNPLTPIQLSAEQIEKAVSDAKPGFTEMVRKAVAFIVEETNHLRRVAHGFLDLAKIETLKSEPYDLPELCREEVAGLAPLFPQVEFKLSTPEELVLKGDRVKVKQALKNLLVNSLEALGDRRGVIELEVREQGEQVGVKVSDDGPGFSCPEEGEAGDLDFTSAKEGGSGLGLFIVRRICELHGGRLLIEAGPGLGCSITMILNKNVTQA